MHNRRRSNNHLGATERERDKSYSGIDAPIGGTAMLRRRFFFRYATEYATRCNILSHETSEIFPFGGIELRMGVRMRALFGSIASRLFRPIANSVAMQQDPCDRRGTFAPVRLGLGMDSMFLYKFHAAIVRHGWRFIHTTSSVNQAIVQKGTRMWHFRAHARANPATPRRH